MQRLDGTFIFSASDLIDDLACEHLVELERDVALGALARPKHDDAVDLLVEKGLAHERRIVEEQRTGGASFIELTQPLPALSALVAADVATERAMDAGFERIAQPTFFDGTYVARPDLLVRLEQPSARWPWSYEVVDTKLALHAKAGALLQLAHYSEQVARHQWSAPAEAVLILGSGREQRFRLADYRAYYRRRKAAFEQRFAERRTTYPREVPACATCRWDARCSARRDADDHLSLVAFLRGEQLAKLEAAGITTLAALATATDAQRPPDVRERAFAALRSQAALQHAQRSGAMGHHYAFRDDAEHDGFALLFAPDDGDVFFDMEGDPLYRADRGLEYLFGVYLPKEDRYVAFWARDEDEEKAAFESLVDLLVARRAAHPAMHVYHYAPYETAALRRLMGRHATREAELDALLRAEAFVDLYAVVRQALRISQPSYSIKKLEPFYGMVRTTGVRRGDDSIVLFERWLQLRDDAILEDIERYNEDDCRSTFLLRQWLLERRAERDARDGSATPWREAKVSEPETDTDDDELTRALLDDLPPPLSLDDLREAAPAVRARWLLGHLLAYHRREAKPAWWRFFDRCDNVDLLAEHDGEALGALTLRRDVEPYRAGPSDRTLVSTYAFPEQRHAFAVDDEAWCPIVRAKVGTVVALDDDERLVALKLARKAHPEHLRAIVPGGPPQTNDQREALRRLAAAQLDGTLPSASPAAHELLLREKPRFVGRVAGARVQPAVVDRDAVAAAVRDLDRSYLFVQGPPGSGKTTTGAHAIVELLAAGRRVAVMSRSHKATHHLLHAVESEAARREVVFAGVYRHSATNRNSPYVSALANPAIVSVATSAAFDAQPHQLAGGTSWTFARAALAGGYDVLVIDEAGQVPLADALACAPAARNLVLLGDPLQLAHVSQGSHPLGADLSVLEHVLGNDATVAPDRGIFLDVSYRMHPEICEFISRTVYDDRLRSAPATTAHDVESAVLRGAGLRYRPVVHAGNGRASIEEAEAIVDAVRELLRGAVTLGAAPPRALTVADILVVTPYNAQRHLIRSRLAAAGVAVRVGTVDSFQGQEAAVVFYSMATSSGRELPRDTSFLFEKNRFNVALSRAQCLSVLVCSPALLDVHCETPEEMALVNLLCAYVEAATVAGAASVRDAKAISASSVG